MKNLVKLSIFALALGFFASCGDTAPKEETTVEATPKDEITLDPAAAKPDSATSTTAKPDSATQHN